MARPKDDNTLKQSINEHSFDERTEAALRLLKDLNSIQEKADEAGFGFLSYLLRMAVLEAQAIASGSTGESDKLPCDAGDSSYEARAPDDARSPSYDCSC